MHEWRAFYEDVAVEWFKLRRRPLSWVLLGVMLGVIVLAHVGFLLLALVPASTPDLAVATMAVRELIAPPNSVSITLGFLAQVGAILAMILGATVVGSEMQWGTVRLTFARQPNRARYVAALLALLTLAVVGGGGIVVGVGLAASLVVAVLGGQPVPWAELAAAFGGTEIFRAVGLTAATLVLYLLLGVGATMVSRSLSVGLGVSVAYYIIDAVLVTNALGTLRPMLEVLPGIGPVVAWGCRLLLGYNLALLSAAPAAALPWPSLVVLLTYWLVLSVAPFLAVHRRDLLATG